VSKEEREMQVDLFISLDAFSLVRASISKRIISYRPTPDEWLSAVCTRCRVSAVEGTVRRDSHTDITGV
jgi:hypothetical protein